MFFGRRFLTALIVAGTAVSSVQAETARVTTVLDLSVANSVAQTQFELNSSVTRDVLTASHLFEPEANEVELLAETSVTDLSDAALHVDDNDA